MGLSEFFVQWALAALTFVFCSLLNFVLVYILYIYISLHILLFCALKEILHQKKEIQRLHGELTLKEAVVARFEEARDARAGASFEFLAVRPPTQ